MRKFLRDNTIAAVVLGLSTLAADAQVAPSGSTSQRQPVPRTFPTEQVAYVRTTFAFNSCVQAANVCTVKLMNASLPYNAVVLRVTANVMVAFNSTTSDVFILGTSAANANELISSGCNIHALGAVVCTTVTTPSNATGNTATQTGFNGGFDLFLKWTGGGGTPSAGLMSVIIEYIMPNDGLCTAVPLGATATGC
jgi:hypothetical protein